MKSEKNKALKPKVEAELVPIESENQSIATTPRFDDKTVERMLKGIENFQILLVHAIAKTDESDWTIQGGRGYLEANGAMKLKNPFGISIFHAKDPDGKPFFTKLIDKDEGGEYYTYIYEGYATAPWGVQVPCQGIHSSRDEGKNIWLTGEGGKKYKKFERFPLSRVDEPNVMRIALSKMVGDGIKNILGLKSVPPKILKEAGLNLDEIERISFGESENKSKYQSPASSQKSNDKNTESNSKTQVNDIKEFWQHTQELGLDEEMVVKILIEKHPQMIKAKEDIDNKPYTFLKAYYQELKYWVQKNPPGKENKNAES